MTISITSHAPSNSFFIAERRPEKDLDTLKSPPPPPPISNGRVPNGDANVAAAKPEGGKYANGLTGGPPGERVLSREEISLHRNRDDAWIVVDGKVFDVTNFLELHPGGLELIADYLSSRDNANDAGPLMRGKEEDEGHNHSKAAFKMLQQFMVGSVEEHLDGSTLGVKSETNARKKYRYEVDLTKPIVAQVGYLGPDYDEWVHDPVISHETPRFFESDFCEIFTRTKWWVIPLVWIPVATGMTCTAVIKEDVPISRLPALLAGGILLWTCLEYLLHRFLFHMKTSSFWGNTLHYVLHGFHHKHPMDGSRLVFPPMFAAPLVILIWMVLGSWGSDYHNKLVIYAGSIVSYVAYDLTHYFLHFGTAFSSHTRQMKRYHLDHHFKNQTLSFGITSTFWDKVFRTEPVGKPSVD